MQQSVRASHPEEIGLLSWRDLSWLTLRLGSAFVGSRPDWAKAARVIVANIAEKFPQLPVAGADAIKAQRESRLTPTARAERDFLYTRWPDYRPRSRGTLQPS